MSKDARACSPDESLASAARVMWKMDCGCVPVVDDDRRVVGVVTDRDVCMAAFFRDAPLADIAIRDAMSRQVMTCTAEDTVRDAEDAMCSGRVRRLPVVDVAGRLVGVLSLNDIAREAEREQAIASPDVCLHEVALTLSAVGQPRDDDDPLASVRV